MLNIKVLLLCLLDPHDKWPNDDELEVWEGVNLRSVHSISFPLLTELAPTFALKIHRQRKLKDTYLYEYKRMLYMLPKSKFN